MRRQGSRFFKNRSFSRKNNNFRISKKSSNLNENFWLSDTNTSTSLIFSWFFLFSSFRRYALTILHPHHPLFLFRGRKSQRTERTCVPNDKLSPQGSTAKTSLIKRPPIGKTFQNFNFYTLDTFHLLSVFHFYPYIPRSSRPISKNKLTVSW